MVRRLACLSLLLGGASGYRISAKDGELSALGEAEAAAAEPSGQGTGTYYERFKPQLTSNWIDLSVEGPMQRMMCQAYVKADSLPHSRMQDDDAARACNSFFPHSVKIRDGPLVTVRAGDPSKPWVVFIHGWPDNAALWVNQLMRFHKSFYCVAVQLPNYLSVMPTEELYLDEVADRIAEVFEGRQVYLVGHDWGANFGYMVAYRHPTLVKKYAALDIGNDIAMWKDAESGSTIKGQFLRFYQTKLAEAYRNESLMGIPWQDIFSKNGGAPLLASGVASKVGIPVVSARMGMYYDRMWHRETYCQRMAPNVDPKDWQSLWTPLGGTGIPQRGMLYVQGSGLATTQKFVDAVVADGGKVVQVLKGHWIPKDGAAELNEALAEWLGEEVPAGKAPYDAFTYSKCPDEVVEDLYSKGFHLVGEREWSSAQFQVACPGGDAAPRKAACLPKVCGDEPWCFVKDGRLCRMADWCTKVEGNKTCSA